MPPEGRERAPALGPIVLWSTGVIARSAPGEAAGLVLLRLLAGVGPGAGVFVLMHLFDAVAALRGAAAGEALLRWTALYAAVRIALSDVPTRLGAPLEEALRQRVGYAVEAERLRRAAHLPLAALEAAETMERLERSGWPGDKIAGVFEHLVSGVLRAVVGIVGIALVFGRVYPWLPAVLVAAALAQGLWEVRAGRGWDALMFDETPERRRADYFADLLTDASAQAELRVFGLYGWLRARWSALYRALGRRRGAMRWRQVLATLPGVGFTAAVALAVLALLAWRLARHALAPGAFVALVGGVTSFDASASLLAMGLSQLARAATKAAWVREVLAGPAPGPAPKGGGRPGAPFPTPLRVGLTCEGVRFRYPGGDRPVLDGLDLVLRPRECVALVGDNGCGKSTLVKLLLGLYEAERGRVAADGVDLRDVDPAAWRRGVAAVFQDHVPFAFTAQEVVGLGRVEAVDDLAAVVRAAQQAGIHETLAALPAGYATPLGRVLEGGVGLSGGQWQRLAIARALMADPQVLLLDEPAASLDPRAEAALYEELRRLARDRAVLLVTHRLGAARTADRILVLHEGRIVEEGTHAALLRADGLYARMWGEQAAWYA